MGLSVYIMILQTSLWFFFFFWLQIKLNQAGAHEWRIWLIVATCPLNTVNPLPLSLSLATLEVVQLELHFTNRSVCPILSWRPHTNCKLLSCMHHIPELPESPKLLCHYLCCVDLRQQILPCILRHPTSHIRVYTYLYVESLSSW